MRKKTWEMQREASKKKLLEEVSEIYGEPSHDYWERTRQLHWMADFSLSMQEEDEFTLLSKCLDAIGPYNDFNPSSFVDTLLECDFHGEVILARSYSVCMYLVGEKAEIERVKQAVEANEVHNGYAVDFMVAAVLWKVNKKNVYPDELLRVWWG